MINCKEIIMPGANDGIFCDGLKDKYECYVETWIHYFPIAV